jgi:hypothetical protein
VSTFFPFTANFFGRMVGNRSLQLLTDMYQYNLTEREAAEGVRMSIPGFKKLRISGKIPAHCYTKLGYRTLRYCRELLLDWVAAPDDLEAQTRAMEQLQNSRVSNLPTKRGRKAA